MDFASLVQSIRFRTNQDRKALDAANSDAHQKALQAYWSGKLTEACELVSSFIAEEPEAAGRFCAYRLWVECLADLSDRASLRELAQHLFLRGQAEPEDQCTYVALRGLIHLELDEAGAARLLARAVREHIDDPYAMEFIQILDNRLFEAVDPTSHELALLRSTAPIVDYLHWQTLARGILMTGDLNALDEIFEQVNSCYRGSPLPRLFEYHRRIERLDFHAAAAVSSMVVERYPDNIDYKYYYAYALFECGDYPAARRVLTETLSLAGDRDPEIVGLLGHCHAKLGEPQQAKQYLMKAIALLKADGLPWSHVSLELRDVEEEIAPSRSGSVSELGAGRTAQDSERDISVWLVELSPRRCMELRDSPENAIERLIRPMGIRPLAGDPCFFGYRIRNSDGERVWKLIASYVVDSAPMWHPIHGAQSTLQLTESYMSGVTVEDLESIFDHATGAARALYEREARLGIYELEEEGVKAIEQALERHYEERFIERRADGGRTRLITG